MEKVRLKYSYKEWDSLIASIGHGGLKEGQIVNKLLDEYEKEHKVEITDDDVLKTQTIIRQMFQEKVILRAVLLLKVWMT